MEQDNHIMIDLETLGLKVNAPIIAIGAVEFNPDSGVVTREFYLNIEWESALAMEGVEPDQNTINWWKTQDEHVKELLRHNQVSMETALESFNEWLPENAIVWGNGSIFDIGKLEFHYWGDEKWNFRDVRDVRTIEHLGRSILNYGIRQHPFLGNKHFALDDARNQAMYVSMVWRTLRGSIDIDRAAL